MALMPIWARGGVLTACALVDDADFDLVEPYLWFRSKDGYAWAKDNGYQLFMHRLILGLKPKDGKQVDHRNRDKLDNQRANLRLATTALNAQNRGHRGGTSSHRGVTWHRGAGKWQASVKLDGRFHYLGLHQNELDAARAASEFRRQHMPFAIEEAAA